MSKLSHYSRVVVHPSRGMEFLRLMTHVAEESRKENGCVAFVVLKSRHEAQTYCISSIWATEADWELHTHTQHFIDQMVFEDGGGVLSFVYTEEYYIVSSV